VARFQTSGVEYTYFNSFSDIIIDLTPYLASIQTETGIDYKFTNIQPVKIPMVNFFDHTEIVSKFINNVLFFDSYTVKDGQRPEDISFDTYKTVEHFWIICIFNNIKTLFNDWAMTEPQLQTLANYYYTNENLYTLQTYYDLLHERNENKRNIILLKSNYLNEVVTAFYNAVNRIS